MKLFRGLKFTVNHGMLGMVSTVLHVLALVCDEETQHVLVGLCALTSSGLALSGLELLPQAPKRTEVFPGVVAPHRDAFKRTSLIMLYINLRLLGSRWLLPLAWYFFVPKVSRDLLRNGNTFVFVVPLFLGVTVDAATQLGAGGGSPMTTRFLLETQLGAMVIAFAFTLAFRGILDIRAVYVWSALCVAGRLAKLIGAAALLECSASLLLVFLVARRWTTNIAVDPLNVGVTGRQEEHDAVAAEKTPAADDEEEEAPAVNRSSSSSSGLRTTTTTTTTISSEEEEEPTTRRLKVGATLGTVRHMFQTAEVQDDDDDDDQGEAARLTAEDEKAIAKVARAAVARAGGPPGKKQHVLKWARQAYVVHKKREARAVDVASNLLAFRLRYGWPLQLEAKPLEAALRSGMHWILPGRDNLGRRVIVYRAAALEPRPPQPLAALQQMMCLLLERVSADDATLTKGLVFIVDLQGASPATLRHFDLNDIKRGMDLVKNAFPLRLKNIFVLRLPRLLTPASFVVKSFLPAKVKRRLHTSRGGAADCPALLADLPASMIPTALGGTNKAFDWDAVVDRLLLAGPRDPADSWLSPTTRTPKPMPKLVAPKPPRPVERQRWRSTYEPPNPKPYCRAEPNPKP